MDQAPAETVVTIGAYDAKTRLSELLDRVERGEQIVITRHGRPIARLVPEGEAERNAAHATTRATRRKNSAVSQIGARNGRRRRDGIAGACTVGSRSGRIQGAGALARPAMAASS